MHIAYANAYYKKGEGGGNVHIRQFVHNATILGHDIWAWPGNEHSSVKTIPTSLLGLARALRNMDVLYVRLERTPVSMCRWSLPPHRIFYRLPVVVWEFNTSPEFGLLRGQTEEQVRHAVETFKHYAQGCDLAVCVSQMLADYVRSEIGIKRVLVVPNGSDPDMFRPDVPPVKQISKHLNCLNVVWIGSGDIAWHNFQLLRDAAQLLWDNPDDRRITFHLIGNGIERIMGEMPPNVNYYGGQDYETLPAWLASMDVGLGLMNPGPGDYNSPLKLFDYMSSGLAVVSTEQPQAREVFEKLGQLDLLVTSSDPKSLARTLKELEADRERVWRLGQAGRQLVIEHYNWRRTVVDTMIEIENILSKKKKR